VRDRVHVELLNSAQRVTGTGKRSRRDQIARRRCRSPSHFVRRLSDFACFAAFTTQ